MLSSRRPAPPPKPRLAFPSLGGSWEVVAAVWSAPSVGLSALRTCVPCLPPTRGPSQSPDSGFSIFQQPWIPLDTHPPGTQSGPVLTVSWAVIPTPHRPPLAPDSLTVWAHQWLCGWSCGRHLSVGRVTGWAGRGDTEGACRPEVYGRPQPGHWAVGQPLELLHVCCALMPQRTEGVCTGAKIKENRREQNRRELSHHFQPAPLYFVWFAEHFRFLSTLGSLLQNPHTVGSVL